MRGIIEKRGRTIWCTRKGVRGQIWVETVIYTLIGLAIIGLVMAAALPKINKEKDKAVIEQSIEALGNIDNKIYEVLQGGSGNRRIPKLEISKGTFIVNMEKDTIIWELDSSHLYSQQDMWVIGGVVDVRTTVGNPWKVELRMNYSVDIRFDNETVGTKQLNPAPTAYNLMIENAGMDAGTGNIIIDMSES